jgi:hypothetical protein
VQSRNSARSCPRVCNPKPVITIGGAGILPALPFNTTRFILSEAKDLNPSLHRPRHNARPQILKSRKQAAYRIVFQIFLLREVFNTSVDKYVEKTVFSKANYTFLSILTRFALFRCKSRPKLFARPRLSSLLQRKNTSAKKQFFRAFDVVRPAFTTPPS